MGTSMRRGFSEESNLDQNRQKLTQKRFEHQQKQIFDIQITSPVDNN